MNKQELAWEKEYKNPKFLSKKNEPQADVLRFFKFLKKKEKFLLDQKNVLDLGCGNGRNSNYLADLDNNVIAVDFSSTAIALARQEALNKELNVDYRLRNIGDYYDIKDDSIDLVLDVTSSNSLNEKERSIYLSETYRVMKKGAYFFVRALAKDGSKNIKKLLEKSPGKEKDTYYIKELSLTERVFSREDFINMYSPFFKILQLEKKISYTKVNNRLYKRIYWIAYLRK